MESVSLKNSPEDFDKVIAGTYDVGPPAVPRLAQAGPITVIGKSNCAEGGGAGAVITFLVALPDGTIARAQATTTAALVEQIGRAFQGWREDGRL